MIRRWSQAALTVTVVAATAAVSAGAAPATTAGPTVTSASRNAPLPAGYSAGVLDNVACASGRLCMGVGSKKHKHGGWAALIERWNGARWILMPSPHGGKQHPTELFGDDCRTASDCVAVGYAKTKRGYTSVTEDWNGSDWSLMQNPNPPGRSENEFDAVSCPERKWCMAVGSSSTTNGPSHALVERWNGTRWSIMTIDHWGGASDTQLLGVSCPSTHECVAVGLTNGGGDALIQQWNGHSWSPTIPYDDDYSGLGTAFCMSADNCLVAGGLGDSGGDWTYVKRWNGHRWEYVDSASYNEGQLYGIACSHSVSFCAAVGDNVETWTGGSDWTYRPLNNWTLLSVSCAKRMCMAVGGNGGGNTVTPVSMLMRVG